GSMFGKLKKYISDEKYAESNNCFTIYTPEYAIRYKVFSYFTTDAEDTVLYRVGFERNSEYDEILNYISDKSFAHYEEVPSIENNVVCLSTCYGEENRFVVCAFETERKEY
ncbi:MAG: class B sortase, partial [Lachnospiraceae bacterium]|nr:class B sortase [Lachnospiraceae bacterium]